MAKEIELGDLKPKRPKRQLTTEKPSVKKEIKKPSVKKEIKKPSVKKEIKKPSVKKDTKTQLKALDDNALILEGEAQVERLQSEAFDANREQVDQYVIMFNKLVRIARKAERVYFKNKQSRDIYALMKVYDQLREVIADMRAMQDISEYVDHIDCDVLQPMAQASAQCIVDMTRALNQFAASRLPPEGAKVIENYMNSKAKAAGVALRDAYRSSVNNTRKILAG